MMSSRTMEFARKHGAIRIRKGNKEGGGSGAHGDNKTRQIFDYLIVIDFESTCWNKTDPEHSPAEIIEFPAVLVTLDGTEVLGEFHQYVFPTERPKLSAFCRELTGITQAQVDAGVPVGTSVVLFTKWLNRMRETHKFVLNDVRSGYKSATFVTWYAKRTHSSYSLYTTVTVTVK
jgi:ERI1 exoribonuclease 2